VVSRLWVNRTRSKEVVSGRWALATECPPEKNAAAERSHTSGKATCMVLWCCNQLARTPLVPWGPTCDQGRRTHARLGLCWATSLCGLMNQRLFQFH
jgi:hypothetical protein